MLIVNFRSAARHLLIALIAVASTACASLGQIHQNIKGAASGPGHDFDATDIETHTKEQNRVLNALIDRATVSDTVGKVLVDKKPDDKDGKKSEAKDKKQSEDQGGKTDWNTVVLAGMDYADVKCEAYLHTLFRLDRDRKTVTSEGSLLGTAAAGAMAATSAAAKDVALVAIAFGLFNSTVDNLSSNLLYSLEPSSVRTIVKTLQASYRKSATTTHASRPAAFATIRGYAQLCVPSNIEAEVNLAVKNANPSVTKGDPQKGILPVVTNSGNKNNESVDLSPIATEKLTSFVFQKEAKDAEAARGRLEKYLVAIDYVGDVNRFLADPAQGQARVWAARALKILD
ncbi:MAG: hypothetical protein ABIT83_08290 [Massilia sp.]